MSLPLAFRSAARLQRLGLISRQSSLSARLSVPLRESTTLYDGAEKTEDASNHFKIERIWAAGLFPIIPASYFIHGPAMDWILTIAVGMHIHWGVKAVIADYGRPFVIGETLAKLGRVGAYVLTGLLFAGLWHFNTNDVGITRAFEMLFAL